jgi:hypothetical protein
VSVRALPNAPDLKNIDAALKQVLRKYAIDPEKIALMSPGLPFRGVGPQNTAIQFFTSAGLLESAGF